MGLSAGQIALDTDFATLQAASSLKPLCRLVATAAQSLADATQVALTFGQEDIDTHGFHSTSVNTSRITPTVPGIYRFSGAAFLAGATTYVNMNGILRKNGVTSLPPADRKANLVNAQAVSLQPSLFIDMNGTTDYMEFTVFQDNTANVAINTNYSSGSGYICTFDCEYLRALV